MTVDREQTLRGEMIRVALRRLLAQDRFEANFVQDAERELDALLAELEQAENDGDTARQEAHRLSEIITDLEARLAKVPALVEALKRVKDNAESWHGPPPEDSGHVRALAVIATWAEEALAAWNAE